MSEGLRFDRRQLLKALGLGALGAWTGRARPALAGDDPFPPRIVFFVQPHGNVPAGWKMPR